MSRSQSIGWTLVSAKVYSYNINVELHTAVADESKNIIYSISVFYLFLNRTIDVASRDLFLTGKVIVFAAPRLLLNSEREHRTHG